MNDSVAPTSREQAASELNQCRLCLQQGTLCVSHVIPNAYFKAMKRQANGKLVAFSDDPDRPTEMSQESWSEELLCSACEGWIGKWETLMIEKLRKAGKLFATDPDREVSLAIDHNVLRLFLLSIVWRASVSSLIQYRPASLDPTLRECIRISLLQARAPKPDVLPTVIRKLVDPRGKYSVEAFETLALSPRTYNRHLEAIRFVVGGYVVDFVTSKVTNKVRDLVGFVHDKPTLRLKAKSFLTVPEIMAAARTVLQKEASGQSKIAR